MATSDELRDNPHAHWGLGFAIDGIQEFFVSDASMEGISTGDGRTVRRGLVREGLARRLGVDSRNGRLTPFRHEIKIEDHVGDLAALFATDDVSVEPLERNIGPGDDLSLLTEFHDKWVGHEKIGTSGERHEYPVPFGFTIGLDHYTINEDADESQNPIHPPPVSDVPVLWKGRRVALYRIFRDHITFPGDETQGWRPVAEWDRIWWGVLEDDGTVQARVWTLRCAGVESWLQRDLGTLYQTKPVPIDIDVNYRKRADFPNDHEGGIAIHILARNEGSSGGAGGGLSGFYGDVQWSDSFEFTADTLTDLRDELQDAATNASTAVGDDGAWSDLSGCFLGFSTSSKEFTFTKGLDVAEGAFCVIAMHKKLWGYLGWDIGVLVDDITGEYSKPGFFASDPGALNNDAPPGDGYVAYLLEMGTAGQTNDRPAATVTFGTDYKGGVVSLDPEAISETGQVMRLDYPSENATSVAHFGSLRIPPASDPNDADAVHPDGGSQAGLWLLSGPRRFANQEDENEIYQVVEASWSEGAGTHGGLVSGNKVVVTRMLNPFNFGYDNGKLKTAWNAQPGQIKARPLVALGYRQGSNFDESHVVMQRIMLSTGTSTGWSSFSNDAPVLDPGDNESTHGGNVVRDAEYADLGLAIPSEMVQHASIWHDESQDVGQPAIFCKATITPGQNAEDVLHGIMQPLGWAWSLRGGQYGIFTPFASIGEEDIEVAITRAGIDRGTGRKIVVPSQELRQFAPIDRFTLNCSWAAYEERFLFTRQRKSLDRGLRYRPGGIEESIDAPAWRGHDKGLIADPLLERLQEKAQFWERRHFVVQRLPVLPTVGRQLWPGTHVRFTHPIPVDPMSGEYGITGRRGVVLYVEEQMGRSRARFLVDVLVHADRSAVPKMHSFSARGIGYDSDNDRILIEDNWLALADDGTHADAAFFVEPGHTGLQPFGGDARVKWAQWDGNTWEFTGTGVVTAVDTTPGSAYLELGAGIATGTYHACKDTIVMSVDYNAQDAQWVLEQYAGIGDDAGEYTPGIRTARWEDLP